MASSSEEIRSAFSEIVDDPVFKQEFISESPLFVEAIEVNDALRECRWATLEEAEIAAKSVYDALDLRAVELGIMHQGVTMSSPSLTLPCHIKRPQVHEVQVMPHDSRLDRSLDEGYQFGVHGQFSGFYAEAIEEEGSGLYKLELYYQVDLMQPIVSKLGVVKQLAAADVDISTQLEFDQDKRRKEHQAAMDILKGVTNRDIQIQMTFLREILAGRSLVSREQLTVLSGCTNWLMQQFARMDDAVHYETALEYILKQRFAMWLNNKTHVISHKSNALQVVRDDGVDSSPVVTDLAQVGPVSVQGIVFRRAIKTDEQGTVSPGHLEPYLTFDIGGDNYRLPLGAITSMTEAQSGNTR